MVPDMSDESLKLKEIVANSKHLVAFTGAGLSAESGIPTYRGAGGLWSQYDPAKYANIQYFLQDPSYYWNFFKDVRYPTLKKARPNPAHDALAALEKQGILKLVITQNIDGLHQMAGQSHVCELHGNTRQIVCLDCSKTLTMDEVFEEFIEKDQIPPACSCGGILKPDVVLFGEALPPEALQEAHRAASSCDTFLVVGSSLVVYPAAQIPLIAKENGAVLAIVNLDPTPLDHEADLVIHESAAQVLSALIQ